MADCPNGGGGYFGARVDVQVDLKNCSDTYPLEADWKHIGALTSKDLDFSANEVESGSFGKGGFSAKYITGQNAGFNFSGEQREVLDPDQILQDMLEFRFSQIDKALQPSMWLRVTTPIMTYTFWVNFGGYSEANPEKELSTYSLSFSATDSIMPPKVEKTIAP